MPLELCFLIPLLVAVGLETLTLQIDGKSRTAVVDAGESEEKEAAPFIVDFFKRHHLNEALTP